MSALQIRTKPTRHSARQFFAYACPETKEGSPFPKEARPLGQIEAETLAEARDAACVKGIVHKETLMIHEVDAARDLQLLHAWRIRQGADVWRKNPVSGVSDRYRPLKPDHLFTFLVDQFVPTRPFDALRDDASGIDRTLVIQKEEKL